MVISRTPLRISFAGGGSDMPIYYRQHGGAVLSVTIDKYIYLSMHPYFNSTKILLKYSGHELVEEVGQIEHRIIRQVFGDYGIRGVDFNSSADVPAGTGLGSSSAFTVGLIHLCNAYLGRHMPKEEIARQACDVELVKLGEPIGKQDQYASALGGLNFMEFLDTEHVSVERVRIQPEALRQLEARLLLFYLGTSRSASTILAEQAQNLGSSTQRLEMMHRMVELARTLKSELQNNRLDAFGEVLHTGWMYKKQMASHISTPGIDDLYAQGLRAGATGGKLLGAGGGGFLLFYVPDERQPEVRKALSGLYEMPFAFDFTGTSIIF